MRVTWDKSADMGYIYIADERTPGSFGETCEFEPPDGGPTIFLDFNKDGKLLGIEIFSPAKRLTKDVLDKADIIG